MALKESLQNVESTLYQVPHNDGTLSFIGDTKNIDKNQPFAFRKGSRPISEDDFAKKLHEASLPFRITPTEILGWGGDSVCVRLPDGDSRFTAVIRSNRELENWEALQNHWEREQNINQAFAPYTIRQNLIVVNGIDNQPAVVKITPEVPGAPLSEVSGVYLFLNKKLIEQYLDITKRNLRRFFTTGIIADPIGHIKISKFRSIFERYGLFLFDTSNLMVDFQRNSLVVIDCEADDISKQPPHRKVQLLSRAFGMGVNISILELFKGLNQVRDRVFSTPSQKEEVDNVPGIDQFKEGFAEAIDLFNTSGLNYRVLGSFATAASINCTGGNYYLTPYRRDRTARDIDVLVLDQDLDKVERLVKEFNSKRKLKPFYPEITLSLPKVLGEDQGYPESKPAILPMIVTRTAVDGSGNFYLMYSGKHTQIPVDYLKPIYKTYEGVEFPTLEPGVLAGFYLTRMGIFKSKDVEKVTTLLDLTNAQIPVEFLNFAKVLRRNWPNLYRNFLTRELMYHFSGGLIKKGIISSIRSIFTNQEEIPEPLITEVVEEV